MIAAMRMTVTDIEALAERAIAGRSGVARVPWACGWLEACGYPGLKLLLEALSEAPVGWAAKRDALGLDLAGISCVWIAETVAEDVRKNGRAFLRNVRHGLYILPFAVEARLAIGCPVDPAFALGGAREKDPYADKLAAAAGGIEVADGIVAGFNGGRARP
jgi:hypothetical protein